LLIDWGGTKVAALGAVVPQADERPSVTCCADDRGAFQMARSTARGAEEEECVQPSHVTLEWRTVRCCW
jgi:hypothetical protein